MKSIALAIFLIGLFFYDLEMTKKFGVDYEAASTISVITFITLIAFAVTLFVEKNT